MDSQLSIFFINFLLLFFFFIIIIIFFFSGKTKLSGNKICFSEENSNDLERYTFSNSLAFSVKLGIWEATLDDYIDSVENVTKASLLE